MFNRIRRFWLVVTLLETMDRKLDQLLTQGRHVMTKIDDVNALLTKIDDETNAVAAEVTALKDQIANSGGISAADADSVVAKLGAISDRLTGIAADPSNPVPAAPPSSGTPSTPNSDVNG